MKAVIEELVREAEKCDHHGNGCLNVFTALTDKHIR